MAVLSQPGTGMPTVLAVTAWKHWANSRRIASACRAGPSVWPVQLRGVPLIRNDARSKWPMPLAGFWQVCANCT
jgi:hypothetical protein